jgi:hypothetical protein
MRGVRAAGATIAATPALVANVLAPEYQQSLAALLVVRALHARMRTGPSRGSAARPAARRAQHV